MTDDRTDVAEGGGDTGDRREPMEYEWDGETAPSMAVVEAVAAKTGRDPTTLPPLVEFVDTDALDALVDGRNGRESGVQASFWYDGLRVSVTGDGTIVLREE